MTFEDAYSIVIGAEGGTANNPADPGGLTVAGITNGLYETCCRAFGWPVKPVTQSTEDERKTIYKTQFWDAARCDLMPDKWGAAVFDMALNSGPYPAVMLAQAVLVANGALADRVNGKTTIDGKMGPTTIAAMKSIDPNLYLTARLGFFVAQNPKEVSVMINGWVARDKALSAKLAALGDVK